MSFTEYNLLPAFNSTKSEITAHQQKQISPVTSFGFEHQQGLNEAKEMIDR